MEALDLLVWGKSYEELLLSQCLQCLRPQLVGVHLALDQLAFNFQLFSELDAPRVWTLSAAVTRSCHAKSNHFLS